MSTAEHQPVAGGAPGVAGCIVMAGGGTGGHISPGLAIAERIAEIAPEVQSVFACSSRRIDAEMLSDAGATSHPIPAESPSLSPRRLLRYLQAWWPTRCAVRELFDGRRVSCVVSLGGFVTPPVVAEARRRGIPVLLVNLDATPGRANRWVARRATETVSAVPVPSLPGFASAVVGMPIRRSAIAPASAEVCREELGLDPGSPVLLVTGASQGAQTLNDTMVALARAHPKDFEQWQVLHLCGAGGAVSALSRAYREVGVRAAVLPFVHRMGVAWGAAELAVSRAGANSVAEAQANHVPTVFVPYPWHKDLHQRENAQPLVDAGAAEMALDGIDVQRNLGVLGARVLALMKDASLRMSMRQALQLRDSTDSARRIAQRVLRGTWPA
jgi:UDP-N-acetylglucosamine--N-acetylmuramyl-(pentapeptide) pyrophosphoryl-undecaprenol N-acetylglucosamine transferase